jgi:hypothetical protein
MHGAMPPLPHACTCAGVRFIFTYVTVPGTAIATLQSGNCAASVATVDVSCAGSDGRPVKSLLTQYPADMC